MWYKLFVDVNMQAPIRHKRVKHPKLPPWLNNNNYHLEHVRSGSTKERMFTEYKKARNKAKHNNNKNLVRNYILVILCKKKRKKKKKDLSTILCALKTFTKGIHSRQKEIPHHFTADALKLMTTGLVSIEQH